MAGRARKGNSMADVALTENDAPSWRKFVADFDNTRAKFNETYSRLLAQQNYVYAKHPEMKAQYDATVKAGAANYNTLQFLQGIRNSVQEWLNNIGYAQGSLNTIWQGQVENVERGVDVVKKWFGLSALGLAPIVMGISVVAASTALALIVKWIADAYSLTQRITAMQKLVEKGYTPEAAKNAVNGMIGTGTGLFGIPWKYVIIGGVVLVAVPFVYKMVRK